MAGSLAGALAGLLVGLAGLAASAAASALLGLRLSPAYAVAEAVVEATPGRLAHWAIEIVGRWDKPLLVTGVLTGLLVLSAAAGALARRHVLAGQAVFATLAGLGAVGVLTRPEATVAALVPVIVGGLTWVLLLPFLVGPLADQDGKAAGAAVAESRRTFLRRAAVVGAFTAVGGVAGRWLGRGRRTVEAARARLDLPVSRGVVPPGAEADVEGLGPWRVANDRFYRIDTALSVPAVEVGSWRLRIHGLVERELTLTFEDLLDRRLTEAWVTICCVSNPVGGELIGNAWWSGVRVSDLLDSAGPLPGADAVLQTSADGWTCGTPLAALTDGRDALLAVAMNGSPLPLEHGFPVRMIVPGLYGFVSATKWLVDLEVTRFDDISAYWTERGWAEQAPVRTQSRVDVPRAGQEVESGSLAVGGVAWAQHTGIEGVEVRLDGGPWTPATLGRVPSLDTWVQWSTVLDVSPGDHSLAVRATDRSGETQTGVQRSVVPDGATGWHTVEFSAR